MMIAARYRQIFKKTLSNVNQCAPVYCRSYNNDSNTIGSEQHRNSETFQVHIYGTYSIIPFYVMLLLTIGQLQ